VSDNLMTFVKIDCTMHVEHRALQFGLFCVLRFLHNHRHLTQHDLSN